MSANRLRELMQNPYDANREFQKAWAKGRTASMKGQESLEVSSSRDKFWDSFNLLCGNATEDRDPQISLNDDNNRDGKGLKKKTVARVLNAE